MKKNVPKKIKKTPGTPLAVFGVKNEVCLLSRLDKKTSSSLFLSWSEDGLIFIENPKKVKINISEKKKEKIKDCYNFSISSTPTSFVMTYARKGKKKIGDLLVVAKSKDLYTWTVKSEIPKEDSNRAIVVYDKPLDKFEMYKDGLFIKNQSTRTLSVWKDKPLLLFTGRYEMFDDGKISVMGSMVTSQGIFVIYDASVRKGSHVLLQAGGVLFDINNPTRVLWRSLAPLWQGVVEMKNKALEIHPLGFVSFNESSVIYWSVDGGGMVIATIPPLFKEVEIVRYEILKKYEKNPIIKPLENHKWESQGTFNPAVYQDEDGTIHLLYRALGQDGISRIGYAQSKDGIHFNKRLSQPVFEPSPGYGMPDSAKTTEPIGIHPAFYTSGGGWGGSEDPRIVRIDNRIYMTYVAFEGWGSVRIALTSISIDDFRHGRWNWKKPMLISPPGEVHKNWVMFPEKIKGKFAVLHSITPNILIDYFDNINDLDDEDKYIKSRPPSGGREGYWDSKVRGAGPPPIKTSLGWLVLYHAVDKREPHKYNLGAMILDSKNPTKILYRSEHAILYPDMWYENEGKPGIVYASGAVIRGDDLYIYYGGGDRVVCIASTPLKEFLDYLVSGKPDDYKLQNFSVSVS